LNFPHHQQQQSSKNKTYLCYQNSLSDDYELVDDDDDEDNNDDEVTPNEQRPSKQPTEQEQWSDIPLNSMTASNSTTSSYSQTSDKEETIKNDETLLNPMNEKGIKEEDKKSLGGGFSEWISNSSFRRQSLEDVFAQSTLFGKFGRSLERRNSESEVENSSSSAKKEFFLFGRPEGLTDSQVESLFLPDEHL
jgi:hypothetical protein